MDNFENDLRNKYFTFQELADLILSQNTRYAASIRDRMRQSEITLDELDDPINILLFKWSRLNDTEYLEDFIKWLHDPNTNCKLIDVIIYCGSGPKSDKRNFFSTIYDNVDYLIQKECKEFGVRRFDILLTDQHLHKLLTWYHSYNLSNDLNWIFIQDKKYECYLIYSEISNFDPFPGLKVRTKNSENLENGDIEHYKELLKSGVDLNYRMVAKVLRSNLSLDEITWLIEYLKRTMTPNSLYRYLILYGYINEYWDNFIEQIDALLENDDGLFSVIRTENTKLLDYSLLKFPEKELELKYSIIESGTLDLINYYFSNFSKESIDALIKKIIDKNK